MRFYVALGAREVLADVALSPDGHWQVSIDGAIVEVDAVPVALDRGRRAVVLSVRIDGRVFDLMIDGTATAMEFSALGLRGQARVESEWARHRGGGDHRRHASAGDVVSPMPGRVVRVLCAPGEEVERGAALIVIEAMKMENELRATGAGRVAEVLVAAGDTVEAGAKLVVLA